MKRAVAYARYSTDKQYDTSIEKQLEDIKKYCEEKGYVLVKQYVDKAESAAKEDRPAFRQMLQDARKGLFDVVVVHKLNRFARDRYLSVVTAHELKKYNVTVESVLEPIGDDPVGQLLWGILDAVNEFERLNTIQEVKMKMRPLAQKGYWMGGRVPYGFKVVKVKDEVGKTHSKLEISEEEAHVVREIFELFLQGYTFKRIAEKLNEKGYTNRGKKWTFSIISEIIRNPRYAGMHFWGRGTKKNHRIMREDVILVEGPAIIDKETWKRTQERLKKYVQSRNRKYDYLLTGLVFCECGAPMHGSKQTIPVYMCKNYKQDTKKHVQISAQRLENYVKGYLEKMLTTIDFKRLAESINEYMKSSVLNPQKLEALLRERQKCEEAISNLTFALAKTPPIAQNVILEEIDRHTKRIEEIDKLVTKNDEYKEVTPDQLRQVYDSLLNLMNKDLGEVVHKLIKRVIVYKSGYIEIETKNV